MDKPRLTVDMQKLTEYKKKYEKTLFCPLCSSMLEITPLILKLDVVAVENKPPRDGDYFPVVPCMCETCGYTSFISLLLAELEEDAETEDGEDAPGKAV